MSDPTSDLERLQILRTHAVLAADAAQELLAQIDAQIADALRRFRLSSEETLNQPPPEPGSKTHSRPTSASPEQRLCYWAIFNAGGYAGEGGKWVQFDAMEPFLSGAKTHLGSPLPKRSIMVERLKSKVGTHLVGDEMGGWRLTVLGEQSMRKTEDCTTAQVSPVSLIRSRVD